MIKFGKNDQHISKNVENEMKEVKKRLNRKDRHPRDLTYIKIIGTSILMLILSSCLYMKNKETGPKIVLERHDIVVSNEVQGIKIYYPKDKTVVSEELEIKKLENQSKLLEAVIKEVVVKLQNEVLIPQLQMEKEVFYYQIDNKVYLDLPQKTFDMVTSPTEELGIIYSFVNSLTSIEGVEKVRILINGENRDKVKAANLSKDYTYRSDL